MGQSKNILTDKEMELVNLLMEDCKSTSDIQTKLKRLFAGTIEQMLEAEIQARIPSDHTVGAAALRKTGFLE